MEMTPDYPIETIPLFKYESQLFCIFDEDKAFYVTLLLLICCLVLIGAVIYLLFGIDKKIKAVVEPNEAAPWNETYSIFFYYYLRIIQV
jgi:hypothetical protein